MFELLLAIAPIRHLIHYGATAESVRNEVTPRGMIPNARGHAKVRGGRESLRGVMHVARI